MSFKIAEILVIVSGVQELEKEIVRRWEGMRVREKVEGGGGVRKGKKGVGCA